MTGTSGERRPGGRPIAPPPITTEAPRLADATRDDGRTPSREWVRERPREPHEKYDLGDEADPRMSYCWVSLKVPYTTMRSPRLNGYLGAGWHVARAADYPKISGYKAGVEVNERYVELGLSESIRPDDPVIRDNLVLMMRPQSMTKAAENELKAAASAQINDHLRQQKERSVKAIGENRTTMSRQLGPADEAPSDAAAEY